MYSRWMNREDFLIAKHMIEGLAAIENYLIITQVSKDRIYVYLSQYQLDKLSFAGIVLSQD